jgi:predicted nucleic acid-binding protein
LKLIDANIILYSVGAAHPYLEDSREIMRRIERNEIAANVSTEVLQEILHFFRRRNQVPEGVKLFDDLIRQFPAPFEILGVTARSARDILGAYPNLNSRDAFHAAVVFEHNLEGIISADRAFDGIAGLTRFDPKELAA